MQKHTINVSAGLRNDRLRAAKNIHGFQWETTPRNGVMLTQIFLV